MNANVWNFDAGRADRNLYITWLLTLWCNYRCSYCFLGNHKRHQTLNRPHHGPLRYVKSTLLGKNSAHSFDNYPAERWIDRIATIAEGRRICLKISGGEPFLDRNNMHAVLRGLLPLASIDNIRVDTNGSFNPAFYRDLDLRKVHLNVSYHPEYVSIDALCTDIKAIQDVGFNIGMVNFVMAPSQRAQYEKAKDMFWRIGVYVNPNAYIAVKSSDATADYEYCRPYLSDFDLRNKARRVDYAQTLCNFPQIGLEMNPDGAICNACYGSRRANVFTSRVDDINALLTEKACLCPRKACDVTNMYSFQCGQDRNHMSMETMRSYTRNALIGYHDRPETLREASVPDVEIEAR